MERMNMQRQFVIGLRLSIVGDRDAGVSMVFVSEHLPDVDRLQAFAHSLMLEVEIEIEEHAYAVAGDGTDSIASWMQATAREIDPRPAVTPDPYVARMNAMEREISSTRKQLFRIETLIEKLVELREPEGARAVIVSEARPDVPQYGSAREMLAAFDRARTSPGTEEGYDPNARDVAHEERAGGPLQATPTNIPGSRHDGTMALVGMPATSQIFSSANGTDENGLPKASKPPRVRDTLYKGNLTRDE